MITSCRSKALRRFWSKNDGAGVNAAWRGKVGRLLSLLDAAASPVEMDAPGLRFHALSGDKAGRFTVRVSGNWRLTFSWHGEDAARVDLEDSGG